MEAECHSENAGVGMQLAEEETEAQSQLQDSVAEEHCAAIAADHHKGQLLVPAEGEDKTRLHRVVFFFS